MIFTVIIILLIIFLLLLLFYKFVFLRDPDRSPPQGDFILSPADGKIISIIKFNSDKLDIKKGKYGKIKILADKTKRGYIISIMMNIFDVHIQRSPIDGKVVKINYKKGKFNNAVVRAKEMRWFNNESNCISIKGKKLQIKLIQIAGFIARRINCFIKLNQKIEKGQRIGNIVLGSMVCMILPENVKLKVKQDQKVKAGQTIIAAIKNEI